MLRRVRPSHLAALASLSVVASLWLPQASAQGAPARSQTAFQAAKPSATRTTGGLSQSNLAAVPWLRRALAKATSHGRLTLPSSFQIGNFSSCPALPTGYDPSQFTCAIAHITGGELVLGNSQQLINRTITVVFAEGTDPSGNLVEIFGKLTSKPMPAAGGIFLNANANSLTRGDRYLQLTVAPKGLGMTPDPTGAAVGFIHMKIKAANPAFGPNCYIGSLKQPVSVDPTIGTTNPPPPNQPISGSVNGVEFLNNETIVIGTLVDNAFAAPAGRGCGPRGALDRVVNVVAGLPSPAGTNTAIFQATMEAAGYQNLPS